jgi:hypothetical protein
VLHVRWRISSLCSFLPINLIKTASDCFHPVNDPFIVVQHKTGRVNEVRSCRLSQTHMTRSRFTYWTDSNIESFGSMNIGETKALGSRIRLACTGNCVRNYQIFAKQFQIQQPNLSCLLCPRQCIVTAQLLAYFQCSAESHRDALHAQYRGGIRKRKIDGAKSRTALGSELPT